MIGLGIGVAELAEVEAGAPCVVLAPGRVLPDWPPLVGLVLRDGVLVRPDGDASRALPLPRWIRPLALVASGAEAELLRPMLPAGLPVVPDADGVASLLAAALRDAQAARDDAAAERDRLKRATPPPRARRTLDLPPTAAGAALPLTQPLGRPAEGLCGIELHVATPGQEELHVTLRTARRILGRWRVPAAAQASGWLALDLPEPAPPGPDEAVIDAAGDARLSVAAADAAAPLALRAATAGPGWSVLPLHFDWAASFRAPALPLPLPRTVLEAAEVRGARATLLALGEEAPRLLLAVDPGAEATLAFPVLPPSPADLLRARLVLREGIAGDVTATLILAGTATTGPRALDPAADFALPLPPGIAPRPRFFLHNTGMTSAAVELAAIALAAGAAGEPRRAPPPEPLPASRPTAGGLPRVAMGLPGTRPADVSRQPGPDNRAQGGLAPPPLLSTQAAYQDVRVHQHLVNGDGSYRHLELGLTSLVSAGGLWRQVRLKLFERRGAVGLEFREMKGWPAMFDTWPGGRTDEYGPFWRLETGAAATALRTLATPHDRALVAALLEVLPEAASRGAEAAALDRPDILAWADRAARLAAAVKAARSN